MTKKVKNNKENKKKPLMTAKEKKAANREKKLNANSTSLVDNNV